MKIIRNLLLQLLCIVTIILSSCFISNSISICAKTRSPRIDLSDNSTDLYVGQKKIFYADTGYSSNVKIQWSSSNTKVAKIHRTTGEITPLKSGAVTITAKDLISGKSKSIHVTVRYTVKQLKKMGFIIEEYYSCNTSSDQYRLIEYKGTEKNVSIPYGITIIGQSAFKNKAIKKINMPNTITKIEYGAFENCKKLSSIALPNSIVEIEQSAFENCTSIEQITLPPKLTSIEGRLFMNCTSLKSIVIPDHVVDIGGNAFAGCTSLTSIQLPESLELIKSIAFKGTTSLETIIAPAYKKSIVFDDDVWEDSKITTSFLYKNGYRYFLSKQMCSDYALIEEHLKNIDILSTDNDLEKIRKVHDYLVYRTSYSYKQYFKEEDKGRSTIDIVLNDKFAICDAYSVTFKGFMDYLDIPCILIASFPMSHVWNMVKLDDDCWYHVDVTWDDPGWNDEEWEMGWINYQHLVRNDAGISINHYGWAEEYFPVANGTLYEDYFDHNYIRQLKSSDFED